MNGNYLLSIHIYMTIATTVAIKHMIDDDPLLVVANRTSGTCIDSAVVTDKNDNINCG